jgi:hypothetical protein
MSAIRLCRILFMGLGVLAVLGLAGCSSMSTVNFPDPNKIFMTSGDGNIQKPYTPVGEIIYAQSGFRFGMVPLLGLIPWADVDPEVVIRQKVEAKVAEMGGDALINMEIDWKPPRNGFLGIGAAGGSIVVTGTVIKR